MLSEREKKMSVQTPLLEARRLAEAINSFIGTVEHRRALFLCVLLQDCDIVKDETDNPRLLLISQQLSKICALVDLLLADSNFNVVLAGLSSFTDLLQVIHKQPPHSVSQRELDSLLSR